MSESQRLREQVAGLEQAASVLERERGEDVKHMTAMHKVRFRPPPARPPGRRPPPDARRPLTDPVVRWLCLPDPTNGHVGMRLWYHTTAGWTG